MHPSTTSPKGRTWSFGTWSFRPYFLKGARRIRVRSKRCSVHISSACIRRRARRRLRRPPGPRLGAVPSFPWERPKVGGPGTIHGFISGCSLVPRPRAAPSFVWEGTPGQPRPFIWGRPPGPRLGAAPPFTWVGTRYNCTWPQRAWRIFRNLRRPPCPVSEPNRRGACEP